MNPIQSLPAADGRDAPDSTRQAAAASPPGRLLVVPGLRDSGAAHWQTWLQLRHPGSVRVYQRHWSKPDLDAWAARIGETIDAAGPGPWVAAAHGFGCLALMRHLQLRSSPVRFALLVRCLTTRPASAPPPGYRWARRCFPRPCSPARTTPECRSPKPASGPADGGAGWSTSARRAMWMPTPATGPFPRRTRWWSVCCARWTNRPGMPGQPDGRTTARDYRQRQRPAGARPAKPSRGRLRPPRRYRAGLPACSVSRAEPARAGRSGAAAVRRSASAPAAPRAGNTPMRRTRAG